MPRPPVINLLCMIASLIHHLNLIPPFMVWIVLKNIYCKFWRNCQLTGLLSPPCAPTSFWIWNCWLALCVWILLTLELLHVDVIKSRIVSDFFFSDSAVADFAVGQSPLCIRQNGTYFSVFMWHKKYDVVCYWQLYLSFIFWLFEVKRLRVPSYRSLLTDNSGFNRLGISPEKDVSYLLASIERFQVTLVFPFWVLGIVLNDLNSSYFGSLEMKEFKILSFITFSLLL